MKIRMLGNSMRLRVSQKDIKTLEDSGKIVESIHFPNGKILQYSLNKSEGHQINAHFEDAEIKTFIPSPLLSEWVNTERVGFEQELPLAADHHFKILIEKDFKCLTDRAEDESDLFPHPKEDTSDC